MGFLIPPPRGSPFGHPRGELSIATKRQATVKVVSLDSFMQKRKIIKVDMVKMDVEGAEVDALSGGKEFLKKQKRLMLFAECNPNTLMRFHRTFKELTETIRNLGLRTKLIINEFAKKTLSFSDKKLGQELASVTAVVLMAQK